MTRKNIDPVSLEITWNGLKSIVDECFVALMRSAFSTNVKERHDHSTAIADARGRLIAQAEQSLPVHLASMMGLMEIIVRDYGDTLAPGDVFVANDPHVAGGTHLPDINLAAPVFHEGRLMGFVANIVHHADVGGAVVGSMSGGLNEIYKEGLRIPVVRMFRKGELQDDVFRLMLLNMRLPDERRGDLNAQVAACKLGVSRMSDLLQRHGPEFLEQVFGEIIQRTSLRMHKAIARIPDGDFTFEDVMEDDGLGNVDICIRLKVTKTGERLIFDFTGTDKQVDGNVNMTLNATQSAVCYSLKALLDPDVPNNHGIFEAFEIIAPKGCFINCVHPAAVVLRAHTCQRVIDVVLGAFQQILPYQVIGAANGANTSTVFSGTDPRSGRRYIYFETLGGGMGARATKDGKDGVQVHITNTSNLPVEAIEMEYPLRIEEYALVEDSGGLGRFRGGLGIRRKIRPVGHTAEFSGVGERFRTQPWGVFGGQPGKSGRFFLETDNGEQMALPSKITAIPLQSNTVAVVETPGAGGYGEPKERAPELLEEDFQSGKYSRTCVKTRVA